MPGVPSKSSPGVIGASARESEVISATVLAQDALAVDWPPFSALRETQIVDGSRHAAAPPELLSAADIDGLLGLPLGASTAKGSARQLSLLLGTETRIVHRERL
jgi:hypothetical protein